MSVWSTVAPLTTARYNLAAATDGQGNVFAIGGQNGSSATLGSAEVYDPATDTWSSAGALTGRRQLAAATDGQGRVYAIGGADASGTRLATLERYNPSTNSWSGFRAMPTARYDLAAASDSQGRIYAIGGYISSPSSVVERYDPATNSWTTVASMLTGRQRHAAVADSQGRIYVMGGTDSSFSVTNSVERYDPASDSWTSLAPMPTARHRLSAAVDGQGNVYAIGGLDSGGYALATVERYNAATNSWTSIDPLAIARYGLAAATDGQGRVYAIGGYTSSSETTTVERAVFNTPPNAPALTSPANNTAIDRGITQRFAWQFSDPDPGDSQSKFDLQWWPCDASWARTGTATTITQTIPNQFYDFAAGYWASGNYEWQVRTYDSQGVVGPWSSSSFFTAATAPTPPTITAPTSGGTVSNTQTVTWSEPNQDSYQIRRVADNAGSADTGTVYYDSGEVVSTTARSATLTFETNNRWEHIELRIKLNGLWSSWADIRVDVSYSPPAAPTVVLTPDDAGGTVTVAITNPPPGTGEPAVSYNDVYVDDGQGLGWERVATMLAPSTDWTYQLPVSGRDYSGAVKVVAVASNGTTSEAIA